ncbi:twitching motility protein PilT [Flavobacterium rivuli WB 3.3-2 = DSM 21788]|uniref:Twitching motility protein PilT n=1 Tax=Flavobacterium rivuli WB 3.3-2 = DSM 21788 TaxID=1121895 RepID=A0A0A2LY48_9FLAO|nr:PIN domain-containing protein [Flavobacterium rivuli]KGO84929.1 twitching motility protein PilT [Flavobacterium rivuli WB 3.3-2 = DSM 21788]
MRLFLDTNVMLDLLGMREPFFVNAARILSLADRGKAHISVSALSYSTTDYFLKKIQSPAKSIEALRKFKTISDIIALDETIIEKSLNSGFLDFEDALQYYSAIKGGCNYIITRNVKDFKKSELPVLTPDDFIALLKN